MIQHAVMKKSIVDSIIGMSEVSFVYSSRHEKRNDLKMLLSEAYHRGDFDMLVTEGDIVHIAKNMTINETYYCIPMNNMLEEAIERSNEIISRLGFQPQYYTNEEKKDMAKDLSQRFVRNRSTTTPLSKLKKS